VSVSIVVVRVSVTLQSATYAPIETLRGWLLGHS